MNVFGLLRNEEGFLAAKTSLGMTAILSEVKGIACRKSRRRWRCTFFGLPRNEEGCLAVKTSLGMTILGVVEKIKNGPLKRRSL